MGGLQQKTSAFPAHALEWPVNIQDIAPSSSQNNNHCIKQGGCVERKGIGGLTKLWILTRFSVATMNLIIDVTERMTGRMRHDGIF